MLPPDDRYNEDDYELPFNKDDYPSSFASYEEAEAVYTSLMGEWHASEGGFTSEDMFNFITEARVFYNEDGSIDYIEFDWETPDGDYSGTWAYSVG